MRNKTFHQRGHVSCSYFALILYSLLTLATTVPHGVEASPLETLRSPVVVTLETGNPIHVVKPGQEDQLSLRLANPNEKSVRVSLSYTITLPGGDTTEPTQPRELALSPQTNVVIPLPRPSRYGVYTIAYKLADNSGLLANDSRSYAYMPPAGPVPGRAQGFLFGISDHPQWYPQEEQELMAMAAAWAGIKVIRDGIDWRRMQPASDRWNFASFDCFLNVFEKYDIELAPTYPGPLPAWATAADWKPARKVNRGRPRPDYDSWATFVRTFATRYKGRIRFVETWNEPDLLAFANFTPEEYALLMEIAYKETKKIDPDILVQSGGFTGFKVAAASSSDPDFLEKSVRIGHDFYDVFAFHGHGTFDRYAIQIQKLADLRPSLGDTKPWWSNETAVSSVNVGEIGQAETLFQKFLYSWAHGAIGYNWYNLRNKGFDPKNNEHNFGLLTKDFYPKPAYVTYNMLARYYREGEFVRAVNLGKGQHGYLFKRKSGDYLLANWGSDLHPVLVAGVTGSASLIDLWGNETPVAVSNGSLILSISGRPSTLRLAGQTEAPVLAGEIIQSQGEFIVEPGKNLEMVLKLSNPTGNDLPLDLNFDAPEGVRIVPAHIAVQLQPGENRDVKFDMSLSDALDGHINESITLRLRVGSLWSGTLTYGVRSTIRVPHDGFSPNPLFVLNDISQVTSLVVNEPSTAHLFWKGVDDLGAKIWLAEQSGCLNLKVIVTDDVHVQPYTDADVWMGDNIQCAFRIPGQESFWEIGLTHLPSGKSQVHVWQAPKGRKAEDISRSIALKTHRDEVAKQTVYEATIPLADLGLDKESARRGFGFNLLVNDNDGTIREGFIAIAPGLGRNTTTTDRWPLLRIDE